MVIQDETWIHHFNSESEQQSMQWNERNQSVVISLHCVTLFFHVICKQPTTAKKYKNIYSPKVILCMSCSEPCYLELNTILILF